MSFKYSVSAIITVNNHGRLARPGLNSLFRAIDYAKKINIETEVIFILDSVDEKKEKYFTIYQGENIKTDRVNFKSSGLSRNAGVKLACGKYVTFLEPFHLIGKNWIYNLYHYMEKNSKKVIAHPEYNIVFGSKNLIWKHIPSGDETFNTGNLLERNCWSSLCGAAREVFLQYPFKDTEHRDWHFYSETLAGGLEHIIIPETVYFIRSKEGFKDSFFSDYKMGLEKTSLFEYKTFREKIENEKVSKTFAFYSFRENGKDESGNENHGEVMGALLQKGRKGKDNFAYYFDGLDDCIKVKLNKGLSNKNISFSLWVNFSGFEKENQLIYISSSDRRQVRYFYLSTFQPDGTHNGLYIALPDRKGDLTRKYESNRDFFSAGKWYHVFLIVDTAAGNIKVYRDDFLIIDMPVSEGDIPGIPDELWLGSSPEGKTLHGLMGEVRIYNGNYKYD